MNIKQIYTTKDKFNKYNGQNTYVRPKMLKAVMKVMK